MKRESRQSSPQARRSAQKPIEQPAPVTPGVTKAMVRQHAFELYREKLPVKPLTLENWVLAEKDLVEALEAEAI
jgi:hypothetical protein